MPVTFLDEEPKKSRITFLDEEPVKKKEPGFNIGRALLRSALSGGLGFFTEPGSEELLPAAGQIAGGIVGAAGGPAGSFAGSTAGATGGEVVRQLSRSLTGRGKFDTGQIGKTALTTAGTEAVFRGAGKALKPISEKFGGRIMNYILKSPLAERMRGKNLGREAFKEGLIGTREELFQKGSQLVDDLENQIEKIISKSKGKIDVETIAKSLDDLKPNYVKAGENASVKAIEDVQAALRGNVKQIKALESTEFVIPKGSESEIISPKINKKIIPQTTELGVPAAPKVKTSILTQSKVTDVADDILSPKTSRSVLIPDPEGATIQAAQEQKRALYKAAGPRAYDTAAVSAKKAAQKASARMEKEAIEKAVPDAPIADINRRLGLGARVRNAAERALGLEEGKVVSPVLRTAGVVGGAASQNLPLVAASITPGIVRNENVLSSIAKLLSPKNPVKIGRAATIAVSEMLRKLTGGQG